MARISIKPKTCSICGHPLKTSGMFVGTGDGRGYGDHQSFAHGRCYDQAERLFIKLEPLYDYEG